MSIYPIFGLLLLLALIAYCCYRLRKMVVRSSATKKRKTDDQNAVADEKPADAAELRQARLTAMRTPANQRSRTRQELQRSKSDAPRPKPVRTPSTATTRPSFGLFGRRSSTVTTKKATTKDRGDAYESVYAARTVVSEPRLPTEPVASPKPVLVTRKSDSVRHVSSRKVPLRTTSGNVKIRPAQPKPKQAEKTVAPSVVSKAASVKSQRTSLLGGLFTKSAPAPEKLVACLTCGADDIPASKAARLPCTHRMCHSCLRRIFKMSVKDPAHMPPRCCTEHHIELKHVDKLFSEDFKKTWNLKFKEYTSKNRIYCPRKGCGEWIQPKHIRVEQGKKVGVCSRCHFAVCAICNQRAHRSRECPKDPQAQLFNDMVKSKGWVKCYNCSATVELKEGCNHMTCRCTAEFCMVCGKKWKSCDCPWFNYGAVGDMNGDPVRYQEEMDRRREQERRDEEMARAMAGMNVRRPRRDRAPRLDPVPDIPAPVDPGQNLVQRAREALTANYQNGEAAARGLLGDWLTGGQARALPRDDLHQEEPLPAPRLRTTHRRRTNAA